MNTIAVISANLGGFEQKIVENVEQSVKYDLFRFTDATFPARMQAMSARLQARIPKMFGWQMAPGYNYYLWVDSSCALLHPDSIKWFLDQLGDNDIAVFKHPDRNTIQEESDYLKKRLAMPDTYITSRYKNELIDEQMAEINEPTLPLYATTAFIYRDTYDMRKMFKEWWYHTSRYHIIDQLSLSYAFKQSLIYKIKVIPDNFMKIPYLTCVRK
jgi:hypothetical protein